MPASYNRSAHVSPSICVRRDRLGSGYLGVLARNGRRVVLSIEAALGQPLAEAIQRHLLDHHLAEADDELPVALCRLGECATLPTVAALHRLVVHPPFTVTT